MLKQLPMMVDIANVAVFLASLMAGNNEHLELNL
jgi:hypothetical protein